MNQNNEGDQQSIVEARTRVRNQFGAEMASKASDAFCLAFGRDTPQLFAALEGGVAEALPARAVIVEFVPQQERIEEVRSAAEGVQRAPAWGRFQEALAEVQTPELRLQTAKLLRQSTIEAVRDDFFKSSGLITTEIERSTRNLVRSGPETMTSPTTASAVTEVCWLNRSIRTRVDPRSLAEVVADQKVDRVDLPRRLEAEIRTTSNTVGAPQFREEKDRSGKGVIIAIIDSEVTLRHPALRDRVIHKQNFTTEPWGNAGDHGSAVAGIAASNDDDFTGMAPEATIYHYKVLASNRFLNTDDFGGALAIQQALEDGADIANCSWGAGPAGEGKSREARAVDTAWVLGLTTVKSAGNNGPGDGTLTTPADADGVVVVGATDQAGTTVQDYSSRGPTPGGMERPHLVAPGGIRFGRGIDSCLIGGGFGDCGPGTSFAAPHVSGLLALILEGEPDLTPREQRERLLSACTQLDGVDANTQGKGLVSLANLP
jgi:serine protease AprX